MPAPEISLLTQNRLLATVQVDELRRFADVLTLRDFDIGEIIHESHQRISTVVFPIDAVMSVIAETTNGEQVEAGLIGNDGVVGIAPFLGAETSMLGTLCQIPGTALVAEVGVVRVLRAHHRRVRAQHRRTTAPWRGRQTPVASPGRGPG